MIRIFALLSLLIVGCTEDTGGSDAGPAFTPLFSEDFESTFTEVRDCRGTIDHGFGQHIRVHANAEAATAYQNGTYPLPVGSVIVKTMYDETPDCGGQVVAWAAMRKESPGFAPNRGDWTWQELDAERNLLADGVVMRCVTCHTGCTEGRDWTCTDP